MNWPYIDPATHPQSLIAKLLKFSHPQTTPNFEFHNSFSDFQILIYTYKTFLHPP